MKLIITLAITLFSVTSMAQTAGKPFQLDPGQYTYECWTVNVRSIDGEMNRFSGFVSGSVKVVKQGDSHIEYTQDQADGAFTNSVVKFTTASLGNNLFKVTAEGTSTTSIDDETFTDNFKYQTTVRSDEKGHDVNVTVKNNDDAEKPGVGETSWQKMADGRIITQTYIREKMSEPNFVRYVSNSTCIYKK